MATFPGLWSSAFREAPGISKEHQLHSKGPCPAYTMVEVVGETVGYISTSVRARMKHPTADQHGAQIKSLWKEQSSS